MNDMNWKTWALVLVIGIGLMFEVFKHMPAGTTSRLWDKENFSFGLTNSHPYSVKAPKKRVENIAKSHPIPAPQLNVEQLKAFVAANPIGTAQQTDFEHKEKGGEGKAKGEVKEAKNPDDYEIFVDPVTGKKYRRKKKKAKPEEKQEEIAKKEDLKPTPKADDATAIQTTVVAGPAAPAAATDKDAPADIDEWIRRLLGRPDSKMTNLFIQQYQQGIVSADTFYKITALMLQDSRVEMKQMGARCAGMNPSLLSFQLLADVYKTENSGSALRTSVDGYLNTYTNLENLGFLQRVLTGTDSYSIVLAAKKVEESANRYLQPTGTGTGGTQTQDTVTLNGPRFQQFLTVLQPLTKSHDANINSQANQTYSTLQSLLGPTATATATGPVTANDEMAPDGSLLVTTTQGP